MASLHLLGTGAAVTDPHRTTTMLACTADDDTLVVDCGGDVVQRLLAAGIDLETISGLVVTHEHPDHVSGFPLFMEKIWLAGREMPIPVYGIRRAIDQARRTFESFDTSSWNLPEIQWREFAYEEFADVVTSDVWQVQASPGRHAVPVVGLRIEVRSTGAVVAYSCDTEPFEPIEKLARGSEILVHEANGEGPGHSSAEQAAAVAARAGANRLLLVHLPPRVSQHDLEKVRSIFPSTDFGEELGTYDF